MEEDVSTNGTAMYVSVLSGGLDRIVQKKVSSMVEHLHPVTDNDLLIDRLLHCIFGLKQYRPDHALNLLIRWCVVLESQLKVTANQVPAKTEEDVSTSRTTTYVSVMEDGLEGIVPKVRRLIQL